jgi:CRISPR-associated protein Csd1
MLTHLVDYARTRGLVTAPGFTAKTVRWALVFSGAGEFRAVLRLGGDGSREPGLTFPRCPDLSQPEMKRGGSGCRHFLVDNAAVVALFTNEKTQEAVLDANDYFLTGTTPDDPELAKLVAKHNYFTTLLKRASAALPVLGPIAGALNKPDVLRAVCSALKAQKARSTENATFSVTDANPPYPVESSDWHAWWREFRQKLARDQVGSRLTVEFSDNRVRCFASGDLISPAPTHRMIRGLADVGGLPTGDALASFKQDSFRSYGLEQSLNVAVSEEMVSAYRAAAEDIIATSSRRLAGARVAHWFKTVVVAEDDLVQALLGEDEGDEGTAEAAAQQKARELLAVIEKGGRPDLQNNHFYCMTLSGASGRVMIRDWFEGQFVDLVRSINAWFDDLAIVRREGSVLAREPKFAAILGALVRDLKDVPSALTASLWKSALQHREIPYESMVRAVARTKISIVQALSSNHARMGLLKAFHIRRGDTNMKPFLNPDHPDPAYHCGRLMAVLDNIQYEALGDVGAGLIERYYAAASSTPALVLGRLLRTSQFHLAKIRGSSPGLANYLDRQLAQILASITDADLPRTLDLSRQSIFALGYYQQKAHPRKTATETSEGGR